MTPERSFSAPCRYYVHAPGAATLSVSAVAAEAGAWTLRIVGGGLDDTRRAHGLGLAESIEVPGPTGLEVAFSFDGAPGTVLPRVEQLALAGAGRVLDLLPALEAGGASASESFEEGLARAVLLVRGLGALGVRRLALYGAGRHTRHLIAHLAGGTPVVAGVVDDDAAAGATCGGLPLVRPDAFAALNAEALVLSSRAFESALAVRAARWLPPGVRLVRLYTAEDPEP